MTDTDVIEERVRRALRAIADQPVVSVPLPMGPGPHRSAPVGRRRTAILAVAAAVVVLVGSLALVYGPRSGRPGAGRGGPGSTEAAVATFVPAEATASTAALRTDARQLTVRLASLGDGNARASVQGRSVVVRGGTGLPVPASALVATGRLLVRPVLCLSAPYTEPDVIPPSAVVPSDCSEPKYSLPAALLVNTATGTSNVGSIPDDPALTPIPTSTPEYDETHPDSPVLLPVSGGGRDLVGPSVLDGTAIASAVAVDQSPQWVVDVTLTSSGSIRWDAVAQRYFHEVLGFDVDGQVLTAPLLQPSQSSFASFDGRLGISGAFTETTARALAAALSSGPLATPLGSATP